jgi:hypothetical protein
MRCGSSMRKCHAALHRAVREMKEEGVLPGKAKE